MDDGLFGGNVPENNEKQNDAVENTADVLNETDDTAPVSLSADENAVDETPETVFAEESFEEPVAEEEKPAYQQQPYTAPTNGYQPYNQQYNAPNQGYPYNQQYYGQQGYNPQGMNNPYQGPAGKPPKKKNTGMKVFIALIAIIVVLAIALTVAIFSDDSGSKNPTSGNNSAEDNIANEQTDEENKLDTDNVGDITTSDSSNAMGDAVTVANVAKKFNVGILIYQNDSLYTEGSGVIVKEDDDGVYTYIVTCAHVVNYSGVAISVLMEDGTEYPADLVGLDTRTDLAVVRIEATGLPLAEIADSDALVVGQTVYAVGNPGGSEFFGSVTNGIISAIDRPVSSSTGYEMDCIQHTSAINPGNSGGALVNGEGKLIGINSMKIASTEYEGMGFSVPSNVVIEVFNSIIENGYVAGRAKLGISYTTPSNYSQTYAMYVQMKGLPSGTIVIAEVNEDSDLANYDIKAGDMIVAVNGKDMTDADMLAEMIENMSAGDKLTLTIVRVNTENWSQTEQDITVTLVEDRGTTAPTTESDNSGSSENPFGNYGGNGSYEDWYEYYKDYFGY